MTPSASQFDFEDPTSPLMDKSKNSFLTADSLMLLSGATSPKNHVVSQEKLSDIDDNDENDSLDQDSANE